MIQEGGGGLQKGELIMNLWIQMISYSLQAIRLWKKIWLSKFFVIVDTDELGGN